MPLPKFTYLAEIYGQIDCPGAAQAPVLMDRRELLKVRFNEINDLNDERAQLLVVLDFMWEMRMEWQQRAMELEAQRDVLQAQHDAAFSALVTDPFEKDDSTDAIPTDEKDTQGDRPEGSTVADDPR